MIKPLGLYIHIPFCRSKCAYCDFYSLPDQTDRMDDYCSALQREFSLYQGRASQYLADTVYIGGGTPSWFGSRRILRILEAVKKNFSLSETCEITMEANPDSVTLQALKELRDAGVNRLSLGVQSADDRELKLAGRPHSFAQARQAVKWAREAGFNNLSLDLIYGLPGQDMESWKNSVEQILALDPEHISCYGLKVEEGTPFWREREHLSFPDDDAQADEYLWLCDRLAQAGYEHYEISNFSRQGRESRHNLKYWTLKEYLGFGPAAYSDFQGERFGYARDLNGYIKGNCALSERQRIEPPERLEEYVMLGLRLSQGIDRSGYEGFGGTGWNRLEQELRMLEGHGLMEETEGHWHCTPQGFLVSNSIIVDLMDYLQYGNQEL